MRKYWIVIACLALPWSAAQAEPAAPSDAQAFHQQIATLFNFDSRTVSSDELDARLKAIDQFASKLNDDKAHSVPLLRAELKDGPYIPVFATEGPAWLAQWSDDPADLQLAADTLARWTIDQVNPEGYVTVLHELAARGANVTAAVMRIADKPDFFTTLSVHVMPVGQSDAMILLLFSMPEDRYVTAVADRLRTERDPRTQKALIQIAYSTATDEGTAALRAFAERRDVSVALRKEVKALLGSQGHKSKTSASIADLRAQRLAAVRIPVGHDHTRGEVFNTLTEALVYAVRHQRQTGALSTGQSVNG